MIMHHIALCTPHTLHYLIVAIFSYALDHAEPKTKIQVEQVQWVFRGPQASSCEDANIIVIKASPEASNPILEFCLKTLSCL
jgi:hypothetical protein